MEIYIEEKQFTSIIRIRESSPPASHALKGLVLFSSLRKTRVNVRTTPLGHTSLVSPRLWLSLAVWCNGSSSTPVNLLSTCKWEQQETTLLLIRMKCHHLFKSHVFIKDTAWSCFRARSQYVFISYFSYYWFLTIKCQGRNYGAYFTSDETET